MIIGLTGGIGSGKSAVAGMFGKYGYKIVDADKVGHKLLNEEIVKKKVIGEFGTANREKLGRIVFNDTSKLRKLNKIMWPLISGKIKTLIKGKKKVVIEAAVLIEAGWHKYVDKVVVVKTNKENQMKRLLKVKRYSKQVINNIIKVQTSQSKRLKYADYIVDNNKSLSELNGQVKGIVSELK